MDPIVEKTETRQELVWGVIWKKRALCGVGLKMVSTEASFFPRDDQGGFRLNGMETLTSSQAFVPILLPEACSCCTKLHAKI